MNFGEVQLAVFCDNLFDSHTVNNYSLGQTDGTYTPQQNAYTFRPAHGGPHVHLARSLILTRASRRRMVA